MEISEYDERKSKLVNYLEKVGIDKDEVDKYIQKEIDVSKSLDMNDIDSRTRALISAVNHFRKYLDKIGNRVKFICLGISQPTDYGLTRKVKDIRKRWTDPMLSVDEKQDMIEKNIVNSKGVPLHTSETTLIEDRIGHPINLDEELQQQLIGVVEVEDGKRFPAMVKLYGKNACMEKKFQYSWCMISGEQGNSKKYPKYIIINTRELLMKPIKTLSRINMKEYKAIVEELFGDITINLDDDDAQKKLEEAGDHVFLKNVRMMNLSPSPYGWSTELTSMKSTFDVSAPILADVKIPNHLEIDVDPKRLDEMWMMVQPREKKPQDNRQKVDVLGMYVESPVDRSIHKMDEEFMTNKEEETSQSAVSEPAQSSREASSFFGAMEKRNA